MKTLLGDIKISEAALFLNVSTQTLRRWDKRGVLKPSKRVRGTRYRIYQLHKLEQFRRKLER